MPRRALFRSTPLGLIPRGPAALVAASVAVSACTGPVRLENGFGPETLQLAIFSLRESHPVPLSTRLTRPAEALYELADALWAEGETEAPPSEPLQRDLIDTLARIDPAWYRHAERDLREAGVGVTVLVDPGFGWSVDRLSSLEIADRKGIEGVDHRHRRPGFGIPMVARVAVDDADPLAPWSPEGGFFLPVTAVASPGDSDDGIVVTLHDPRAREAVAFGRGGRTVPLAADFTAPFAFHAAEHAEFANRRLLGVVRPGSLSGQEGLHLVEPYDPDRIPLVLVHGFAASQLTWIDLPNDVLGDPELRRRYQVWLYHYPTGVSWLAAAAEFRQGLADLRTRLSEAQFPAPPDGWVVVAHSMGGHLAKTLVSTSHGALWAAADPRPIESLDLDEADRVALRDLFEFEPLPAVGRVVFVASPLNGSKIGGAPYAKLGARLARTPDPLAGLVDRTARALGRPADEVAFDRVTLIGDDEPVTTAFAALPIERPFHLVLGRKWPLPHGRFSDGIVSSDAARVDGAESERVVGTDTHNVHHKAEARVEILRILREHAAAVDGDRDVD